jgi:rod shape-determining protein MreC
MVVYQRGRRRSILAMIILTTVTLITLDLRGAGPISALRTGAHDVVGPIADGLDAVFSPIGDWIDGVTHAVSLRHENARLKRERDEARGQAAKSRAASQENNELRRILDLPFVEDSQAMTAQVVAGPPSNFEWTVQISRGSRGGVAKDMPVVTGAGLVGRVTDVSADRATVLLLKDPDSGVGVKLEKSGAKGVVQGRADSKLLRLEFVDPNVQVTKGELVYTSGQETSRFPPSIPVAKVERVEKSRGDLQQDILVKPLVDFGSLDYVKVLRWPPAP